MSIYNIMRGHNPACYFILPMLGKRPEEYPRFRDCFVSDDGKYIDVYTRVGGGNRDCGYGEEELYADKNFVSTWDDDFDSTYGYYRFKVPEKWKSDFAKVLDWNFEETSKDYKAMIMSIYPDVGKKYFTSEDSITVNKEENK